MIWGWSYNVFWSNEGSRSHVVSALDPGSEWSFPCLLGFVGALYTLPQIMAPWRIEYFKPKTFEKMAEAKITGLIISLSLHLLMKAPV